MYAAEVDSIRNVTLAEEAVNTSRAFTEDEALRAVPPLIDLVASDIPDLLRQLDGRTVTRFDGTSLVLTTTGAQTTAITMSLRQRVLGAVANPNVAYILLSLGTLGVTIELWNPGAVLPGVAGGLCLLLASFALHILPSTTRGCYCSMARQAEAERERRAKVIHAAGELEASDKLAQAAAVIASQPLSITLRYLQTLTEIAAEKNSTIIFPLPIELLELLRASVRTDPHAT